MEYEYVMILKSKNIDILKYHLIVTNSNVIFNEKELQNDFKKIIIQIRCQFCNLYRVFESHSGCYNVIIAK